MTLDVRDNQLYLGGLSAESLAEAYGTPLYVYEEDVIRHQAQALRAAFAAAEPDLHYALKANNNPAILAILREEGMQIDAVSANEVRLALELGFAPQQILFTGNNTTEAEVDYAFSQGVRVNLGSLEELARFGRAHPGSRVSIRINPDVGAGHHHHVITGGPHSKFGIYHTERAQVLSLLAEHKLILTGIHSHIGSSILKSADMLAAQEIILDTARHFPDVEFIDFGGGFGIPYRPDEEPLDLATLGRAMCERFAAFAESIGKPLRMKLEPGRFLVAQAATLLVRVTTVTKTPAHTFVGTDSGFNHLVRPVLYSSYHHILNASAITGEEAPVVVAGNICESGDVFTHGKEGPEDRMLTRPAAGDLLALRDVGAYGMAQASNYNLRARPAEILVKDGAARLIRRRETYEDLVRCFIPAEAAE